MTKLTYPIVLATLPLLWGLQRNQGEIALTQDFFIQILMALLVLLILGGVVLWLCNRFSRRDGPFFAALCLFVLVFFSQVRPHWAPLIFAIPVAFVLNRWRPQVIEWGARTLVLLILGQLLWVEWNRPPVESLFQEEFASAGPARETPDVYYLVFDSFGSEQLLQEDYGENLSELKESLSKKGFVSNEVFWSNYPTTLYSLASTLNMNYLEFLPAHSERYVGGTLASLIGKNRAMRTFQNLGYETVGFESYSGVPLLEKNPYLGRRLACPSAPALWRKLLRSSALWPLLEKVDWEGDIARSNTQCLFERLANLKESKQPKFVFGYFWVPHAPHVFAKNRLAPEKNRYVEDVRWLAEKLPSLLESILEHSPDAIVVLQSDHGPGKSQVNESVQDWFGIFNAIRAPKSLEKKYLAQKTPVNTFRNVLSFVTKGEFPVLKDDVWWVQYEEPTRVRSVPLPLLEGRKDGLS